MQEKLTNLNQQLAGEGKEAQALSIAFITDGVNAAASAILGAAIYSTVKQEALLLLLPVIPQQVKDFNGLLPEKLAYIYTKEVPDLDALRVEIADCLRRNQPDCLVAVRMQRWTIPIMDRLGLTADVLPPLLDIAQLLTLCQPTSAINNLDVVAGSNCLKTIGQLTLVKGNLPVLCAENQVEYFSGLPDPAAKATAIGQIFAKARHRMFYIRTFGGQAAGV